MANLPQPIMYLKRLTKIGRQKIVFMKENFPETFFFTYVFILSSSKVFPLNLF